MNQERNIAYEIALEYCTRAEAYDRTVCTGPITKDGIMPNGYKELYLVNIFASNLLKELRTKAQLYGIDWSDVRKYISTI